jgi:hypothetical protein
VTVTPGSAPPVPSETTPLIVASEVCASTIAGKITGIAVTIESTVAGTNRVFMRRLRTEWLTR